MPESIEIQFARLDERFKALEKKQDDHHKELIAKIQDLADGTSEKLSRVENDMYGPEGKVAKMDARVISLEKSNSKYFIVISLYSVAVASMIGLIIIHILQTT